MNTVKIDVMNAKQIRLEQYVDAIELNIYAIFKDYRDTCVADCLLDMHQAHKLYDALTELLKGE